MILLIRSIPFTTPAQMTSTVRKIATASHGMEAAEPANSVK